MTNYEKIIDPNNLENIVITNSKGDSFELEQIALIPLHDTGYAILKPLKPELLNMDQDEPLIFKLNDEEGKIYYIYVCSNGQVATGVYWPTTTNGLLERGPRDFGIDGRYYPA